MRQHRRTLSREAVLAILVFFSPVLAFASPESLLRCPIDWSLSDALQSILTPSASLAMILRLLPSRACTGAWGRLSGCLIECLKLCRKPLGCALCGEAGA